MEHSQAIVSKNAHGIQRAPPWDGAWDSRDSVSVSMAPPDENAWSVQMGSSVSLVRRPANLQRRVTEGATVWGTAHVAAETRLRETSVTSACPGTSDIFVASLARRIAAASMDAAGPMASACAMRDGPGIVATDARRGDTESIVVRLVTG